MIKFETNHKNAPSWKPTLDFSHNVSFERNQPYLAVFPKALVNDDNTCMIYFNCFGLRYKHFDKFSISVVDGKVETIENSLSHIGHPTGSENCFQVHITPASDTGVIQITDSFTSHNLLWEMTKEHLFLKLNNYKVMIHFDQGVIDIPNQESNLMMIDFLQQCRKQTTDEIELASLDRQIAKYMERNSIN